MASPRPASIRPEIRPAGEDLRQRLARERRLRAGQIARHGLDLLGARRDRPEEIAPQRLAHISLRLSLVIGGDPAVKARRHPLHPLAHAQVARAHLAQIGVHIGEEHIHQRLGHLLGSGSAGAQPPEHEIGVKRHHLEAPVEAVRNPVRRIETGIAGAFDDGGIEPIGRRDGRLQAKGIPGRHGLGGLP